jgi:flagellar basal-body rod protein FlgC
MNLFSAMEIIASGLCAQRTRLNLVASNLANAQTTRTPEGGPYRRRDPVFVTSPVTTRFQELRGDPLAQHASLVDVSEVAVDDTPPRMVYDPEHPDADTLGYVQMPNINVIEEMVNMMTASRAYEAGVTAMQTVRSLAEAALRLGQS